MKIGVLIPCYNEEVTIGKTLEDFLFFLPEAEICICDNNSSDNTVEEVKKFKDINLIYESRQGKGYAMQSLFKYAKDNNFDISIMVDGDNTYSAQNVKEFIDKITNGNDMVIGVREAYFKENKKLINGLGNKLLMFLLPNNKDPLSGYRAFSKNFVDKYPCDVSGFDIEMDMNLWSRKNNMKIDFVTIDYKDRPEGSYSKINWKDGIKILWNLLKNI